MKQGVVEHTETDKVEPPSDLTENKDKHAPSDGEFKDDKAADDKLLSDEVTKSNVDKIEPTKTQSHSRTKVDVVSTKSHDSSQIKTDDKTVGLSNDHVPVATAAPKLDKSLSSLVINVSSLRDIEPTKTLPPTIDRTKTANGADGSSSSVVQSIAETKSEAHKIEPTADPNQGMPTQSSSGEKTPSLNNVDSVKDGAKDAEEMPQNGASEQAPSKPVIKIEENTSSKVVVTKNETPPKSEGTLKPDASPPSSSPSVKSNTDNGATSGGIGGSSAGGSSGINSGGVFIGQQKESVFMRLNNRIKDLELNMSLSSRYLEELSQR